MLSDDPKVTLTIGKNTKLVVLREGSEAVMECTIKANPIASDIQFLLNGSIIEDNEQNGSLIDYWLKNETQINYHSVDYYLSKSLSNFQVFSYLIQRLVYES